MSFFGKLKSFLASQATPKDREPQTRSMGSFSVLFGSQTGNAEYCARKLVKTAKKRGFSARSIDLWNYSPKNLLQERTVLIVTSTYGEGEMPDNAERFFQELIGSEVLSLDHLKFAVFSLGDRDYGDSFCMAGRLFDQRLEELGGHRMTSRIDCDVDYYPEFVKWQGNILDILGEQGKSDVETSRVEIPMTTHSEEVEIQEPLSEFNLIPLEVVENTRLNKNPSQKETRHVVLKSSVGSLSYEPGDSIGFHPRNSPELVEQLLRVLGFSETETVTGRNGQITTLGQALIKDCEIGSIPPELRHMADWNQKGGDLLDLLSFTDNFNLEPQEFIDFLLPLSPRLYSIASSRRIHREQVDLTVGIVRYSFRYRERFGVCTKMLAELPAHRRIDGYVHQNANFRLPEDLSRSIIMIGPGTGVAPFRAFLQDREAAGANGRNWLFFGDRNEATDFLYRDEFLAMIKRGVLHELDTAFSRDQVDKIYVQHRMLEHRRNIYHWLEDGAYIYVCGDKARMAPAVEEALIQITIKEGGKNRDSAANYIHELKETGRYRKDVY